MTESHRGQHKYCIYCDLTGARERLAAEVRAAKVGHGPLYGLHTFADVYAAYGPRVAYVGDDYVVYDITDALPPFGERQTFDAETGAEAPYGTYKLVEIEPDVYTAPHLVRLRTAPPSTAVATR